MAEGIRREEAGHITKKLLECRKHLQAENVYSCITGFRDVLEKMAATRMLPADEKQLQKDVNAFQYDLSVSKAFRHLYGPVTFKDDDNETALEFMKQLNQVKEEEIAVVMENHNRAELAGKSSSDIKRRIEEIMLLVEKGDFSTARDLAAEDEEAADHLIEKYNHEAIQFRKAQDFDPAFMTFKKALFLRPNDEGLYYNLARAHIEAKDWASAKNVMEEGLKENPDFQQGQELLAYIVRRLA